MLAFAEWPNHFNEFEVEMGGDEQTITYRDGDFYIVNVFQSPGILIGSGKGTTEREAIERAIRLVELLNSHGL